MIKKRINNHFLYLLFILMMLFILSPLQAQEHEKIVEKVVVENIEIPVRVFHGKQPVGGLKKEDFQLYLNGKKREINGFYEVRKKIEDKLSRDSQPSSPGIPTRIQPRLFVLIFNLSHYTQDFTSQLDTLFERIIKPDDHLMIITNRYFLPEWEVVNAEKTKRKIKEILDKEINKMKFEMIGFESRLKANASMLKSRLYDPVESKNPSQIFQEFFLTYNFILEDMKDQYLSIPVDQYIKIAGYLKSQQMDKWVLNFYQLGRLPLMDSFGEINRIINSYIDDSNTSRSGSSGIGERPKEIKQNLQNLYLDFLVKLKMIDNLLIDDIGKAFLKSGATVHTQLLNPTNRYFSTDFKYETVTTESESILKKLSRLTGGSVVTSNRTEDFVKNITVKEDVVYILTYAPDAQKNKKKPKLDIKIKNRDYRVVYDDQRRLKSFREMMARFTQDSRDIEIQSLSCQNDLLTVKLKNIRMVRYEGKRFGAVQARIKVLDKGSRLISGFEKVFKGIKDEGIFQVKLPFLASGDYHIVLEVKDLFSLKSVYAGDAITIRKN